MISAPAVEEAVAAETAAVADLLAVEAIPVAEAIPVVILAEVVIRAEVAIPVADIEVEAIPAVEEDVAAAAEVLECPALFSMTLCSLALMS
jgi:hypothetical protein